MLPCLEIPDSHQLTLPGKRLSATIGAVAVADADLMVGSSFLALACCCCLAGDLLCLALARRLGWTDTEIEGSRKLLSLHLGLVLGQT